MARVDKLPERAIIDGFKGVIDFYDHRGIACVRKWPTYRPRKPHAAEAANQQLFALAVQTWPTLSASVKTAWADMAAASTFTGRDAFTSFFMKLVVE